MFSKVSQIFNKTRNVVQRINSICFFEERMQIYCAVVASVQSKHETIMHLQNPFNKSLFIYMNFTESSFVTDVLCCQTFLVELILATLDFLLLVHRSAVAKCRVAIFVSHVCMLQMSLEILIGSGILPLSILFLQNLILNGIDLQYQT